MSEQDRRTFLTRAAGAVPAAALVGSMGLDGCIGLDGGGSAEVHLTSARLHPLAEAALPSDALGEDGLEETVTGFVSWIEGFEPEAELTHPYLDDRIRYGPSDPAPRWGAQLAALDAEAQRSHTRPFADLPVEDRRALLRTAIAADTRDLPSAPARAEHVAVGLLAWFYRSSEANDLCYGRRVGRQRCRGIDGLALEPPPLEEDG